MRIDGAQVDDPPRARRARAGGVGTQVAVGARAGGAAAHAEKLGRDDVVVGRARAPRHAERGVRRALRRPLAERDVGHFGGHSVHKALRRERKEVVDGAAGRLAAEEERLRVVGRCGGHEGRARRGRVEAQARGLCPHARLQREGPCVAFEAAARRQQVVAACQHEARAARRARQRAVGQEDHCSELARRGVDGREHRDRRGARNAVRVGNHAPQRRHLVARNANTAEEVDGAVGRGRAGGAIEGDVGGSGARGRRVRLQVLASVGVEAEREVRQHAVAVAAAHDDEGACVDRGHGT